MSILQSSRRMPVLFVGHGSPMNALPGNAFYDSWQQLGCQFGQRWPKPQLILCISAHWLTQGWALTAMAQPRTIYDFGGFPQALYQLSYPASGSPALAQALAARLRQPTDGQPLRLDDSWGLDHGAWGVLLPMFGAADVPVIQLSMDAQATAADHVALGRQLQGLREQGVLIVASGNIVHNLRAIRFDVPDGQTYDWAQQFDDVIAGYLSSGNLSALQNFQQLGALATQAHPSADHFWPLLYAAAAAEKSAAPEFFNATFQAASISMRSVIWD